MMLMVMAMLVVMLCTGVPDHHMSYGVLLLLGGQEPDEAQGALWWWCLWYLKTWHGMEILLS